MNPTIQGVLGQSRREPEVNDSLATNAEVRNEWSCTCTPHACLIVVGRKKITFFVDFVSVPCDFIVLDAFSSCSSWLTSRGCVYCANILVALAQLTKQDVPYAVRNLLRCLHSHYNLFLVLHTPAVDRTGPDQTGPHKLFSMHRNVSGSLLFAWKNRGFKKSAITRLLRFNAIINQVVRIYVNIRTALSTAVAITDCEGCSITHVFYLLSFCLVF
jgi:hypothetical protein